MFNSRPVGRHKIEVCTNVSCMLRNSGRILTHIKDTLHIGRRWDDAGRAVHACGGRVPRFVRDGPHDAGGRRVLRESRRGESRRDSLRAEITMEPLILPPVPGSPGNRRLRGPRRLRDAAQGARNETGRGDRRGEEVGPPRARRRVLSHRAEVDVHAEADHQAEIPLRERRRERAGNVQGPADF